MFSVLGVIAVSQPLQIHFVSLILWCVLLNLCNLLKNTEK